MPQSLSTLWNSPGLSALISTIWLPIASMMRVSLLD